MAGSDIRAGQAFVELYVKGTFKKDLADAQRKLKAFGDGLMSIGKKMLGMGTAISAPLLLAVHQFSEMGNAMNRAAQRTGIAVEALSALKFAADESGLSFEDLENSIRKMEKAIFSFENGSKEAGKSFEAIGISVKDLKGLSPDQQFLLIADKLSKVSDAGARAALAMEIFGKNGTVVLPFIQNGAEGIKKLTDEATELGLVMSTKNAEAATKFHQTLSILHKQLNAVMSAIGSAVAEVLQPFATGAIKVMTSVIAWVRENRQLVVGLILAAAALITAGSALIAFAVAVKTVILVGSATVAVIQGISSALVFLANPVVLVTVALAALAAYFIYASGIGAKALAWLGERFGDLKTTAMTALGGIADALAAGDIQLAGQILWVALQLMWAQGTDDLMKRWIDFKWGMTKVAIEIFYAVLDTYENVKADLISSWINTVAIFGDIWDGFTDIFGNSWDNMTSQVAKGILYVQSLFDGSDYNELAKSADAQLEANISDRDKQKQAQIQQRADQLEADLAAVTKERDDAIAANDDEALSMLGGADEANKEEIDDLEQRKKDLEDQLKALRKKAADEKAAIKPEAPPLVTDALSLDDVLNNRAELKAKAQGTFNVAAIQSLQATSADDYARQTAKNTAEVAKNTKNTAKFK